MSSLILHNLNGYKGYTFKGGKDILFNCRRCLHHAVNYNTKSHCWDQRSRSHGPSSSPPQCPAVFHHSQSDLHTSVFKSNYLLQSDLNVTPVICNKYPFRVQPLKNSLLSHQTAYSLILNSRLGLQSSLNVYRNYQTSAPFKKDESKVEKTVKALKDSSADKQKAVASTSTNTIEPVKKTLVQKFVDVVKHYYHGFRLLFIDFRICSKLIWKVLKGKTLTRRESNQLVRTTADLFRLVPLLVFVLVPFAELALPFVLKLFPNMLPSTFQDKNDEKEKYRRVLRSKIEMAKFLQKTIEESAVVSKKKGGQSVESFSLFMHKIREEGSRPHTADIMKFAKLFEDEITLDNLSRQQLRACCTMLNITPIGTDALLRFLLEMKLRGLLADDKSIQQEGVDSLNTTELQSANRARGMRAMGVTDERLRDQLRSWLALRLEHQIPTSLLLLSRVLYLPETLSLEEKISATITTLPKTAADEARLKAAEMVGEKVDNKTRLEIIKREEEIIKEEKAQQEMEEKLVKEKNERDSKEAKAAEVAMEHVMTDNAKAIESKPSEELVDAAELIEQSPRAASGEQTTQEFSAKDLDDMEVLLAECAKEKKIDTISDDLKELKEDFSEYKEDLEDLADAAMAKEVGVKESKAAKRLSKKVERMIKRLDQTLETLQEEKDELSEKLKSSEQDLKEEIGDHSQAEAQIKKYKTSIVSIQDVMATLRSMRKEEDQERLVRVFEALDTDKDGKIDVNEALDYLEVMSAEGLRLSESQLEEITVVLKQEDILENEAKDMERKEKQGKSGSPPVMASPGIGEAAREASPPPPVSTASSHVTEPNEPTPMEMPPSGLPGNAISDGPSERQRASAKAAPPSPHSGDEHKMS